MILLTALNPKMTYLKLKLTINLLINVDQKIQQ